MSSTALFDSPYKHFNLAVLSINSLLIEYPENVLYNMLYVSIMIYFEDFTNMFFFRFSVAHQSLGGDMFYIVSALYSSILDLKWSGYYEVKVLTFSLQPKGVWGCSHPYWVSSGGLIALFYSHFTSFRTVQRDGCPKQTDVATKDFYGQKVHFFVTRLCQSHDLNPSDRVFHCWRPAWWQQTNKAGCSAGLVVSADVWGSWLQTRLHRILDKTTVTIYVLIWP